MLAPSVRPKAHADARFTLRLGITWGCFLIIGAIIFINTTGFLLSMLPSRQLHVRGQLDRTSWIIHVCDSGKSYRVIMTSGQWAQLLDYQREFHIADSDPLIIEFDGSTTPPPWSWTARESIGINSSPMHLERGTCR